MPDTKQQDTLSELVVKEAIDRGLDSSMRDSILEAVEEADGSRGPRRRPLALAASAFGLGAAVGFLAGRESPSIEETPLSDVEEPEIIEDVRETATGESPVEEIMEVTEETTAESEPDTEKSPSRFLGLVLVLGVAAAVAYLRRRFAGDTEDWEPIEEFEPATDLMEEDETEDEADAAGDEDEDADDEREDEDADTDEDADADADAETENDESEDSDDE
ncbi:hypothetical protein [Natrialba taiwanensis]|uniref:MYXO-CTERM domain-containing protein n=1 Tax=Natrialba taiwanensis DSM 12281 TaxID=1230458 RepID=L9ZXE7_9EURY|nr:hypothetical protein [Natrialba taiwanensis]ELY90751.1 hypothetical protein C484_11026 [Natrialba taiwanensis DSM 12281]